MEMYGIPAPRMDWDSANLPEAWRRFKQQAELMFSGPLREKEEPDKCSYLLLWIGEKGRDVYDTWTLTADEAQKLKTYYDKYAAYITPKSNLIYARYRFHEKVQANDESFEHSVTDLKLLVKDCGYPNSDEMVRDRIVFATNSPRVRKKLLSQGAELTLEKAIDIARSHELAQTQLKEMTTAKDFTKLDVVHAVNSGRAHINTQKIKNKRTENVTDAQAHTAPEKRVLLKPEGKYNTSHFVSTPLHHQREEPEQSQEYLSRVEQLSREHPTEGDLPRPEVLAEKAWSLMKFSRELKLEAVELFEAALKQEPHRAEWRSSQVIGIASAHKHDRDGVDQEVLKKMQEAHENDPENLYLSAVCLIQRQLHGESVEEEMNDLANRIIPTANSSYSGIKPVIRFYRQIKQENIAIFWAEAALERHPESRYVIRCAALCYKWRILFTKDEASQRRLLDKAMFLQKQVIQLYPHSALVKEMDLADLYSKSEINRAEEMYKSLLQRNMEPSDKQVLYNRYAKYLLNTKQNQRKAIKYFKKAVRIDYDSFFRDNSIENLCN
ncbi:hypothetical protein WMY93_032102 [Mugilogobius chulae]|uniref:Suppressor of forked domain-containing protein n=1 Tax=Mugilogobius chulae TaxID=88201 RepID=A0AAW0MKB7_9GOBI